MSDTITLVARIVRQGPQAPLAGDGLALPVYLYEALESSGGIGVGVSFLVAHREADVDDPSFARGRLRRLHLSLDMPAHASLLHAAGHVPAGGRIVWYCERSEPVSDAASTRTPPP